MRISRGALVWFRQPLAWLIAVMIVAGGWLVWRLAYFRSPASDGVDPTVMLRAWDKVTGDAFARAATEPVHVSFPSDHSSHGDRPFEVWEFVAHFASESGPEWLRLRLTRLAAAPHPPNRRSAWAANELMTGELIGQWRGQAQPLCAARLGRSALGIAGHTQDPPTIWIDGNRLLGFGADEDRSNMSIELNESWLDGTLDADLGANWVGRDAAELTGGLWRGYLFPKVTLSGGLGTAGLRHGVRGTGWFLHNWGPLPPVGGQVTFDRWFIQLDRGGELAVLQTRQRDAGATPTQRAVWIGVSGESRVFDPSSLSLDVVSHTETGPSVWSLVTSDGDIRLQLERSEPVHGCQVGAQGWSAALRVRGEQGGHAVTGWGLVDWGSR